MRSDDEPETISMRTRFPIIVQLVRGEEKKQEFTIRRALEWAMWSAAWWLLVVGLYVIATSASSPNWAAAISLVLVSIVIFVALLYSVFAMGYFFSLLADRRRLCKKRGAQT